MTGALVASESSGGSQMSLSLGEGPRERETGRESERRGGEGGREAGREEDPRESAPCRA